jgi:protease I
MRLRGKRIAILAEDLYQDLELWYPYLRFKEEGAEVLVVAPDKSKIYSSKHGYPVTPDKSVSEVDPKRLDCIVIPGGYAPDLMRRHPQMVKLVKDVYENDKIIGAICHAGWMLISAGIVKGKKLTSFFAIKDDLVSAGAIYLDQEVVVDGKLVTSRKPDDLPAFCREIIRLLEGT